jgi:hypothetical protein
VLLASVLLAGLLLPGCTFRLIADYDEVLVQKTVEVQEQAEALFLALAAAGSTPQPEDGAFAAHAAAYDRILVLLRVMEVRASTVEKNEITIEQVELLRDSVEKIRATHQQKSAASPPSEISPETIGVLREPFVSQIRAILKLQRALRRGA